MLETATVPMLRSRASLHQELATREKQVRKLAQNNSVCRRLMTMPGIGAVVALTFLAAVDDPTRFRSSKRIGPWVGLTHSRNQSGERDVSGGITKAGGVNLRRALCQAATVMMNRGRSTWLRTWGAQLAQSRGRKIAMVALARLIAVVLHRIWVDGTVFQPDAAPQITTTPAPTRCLLDRRLSSSRRDAVPMMPRSGPSLTSIKRAYEMGTSELHRTSIMLAATALTTNRSMYPKDLSRKPRQKTVRTRRSKCTALADHFVCPKTLDGSAPVTKVLTLETRSVEAIANLHLHRFARVHVQLRSARFGPGGCAPLCSSASRRAKRFQ